MMARVLVVAGSDSGGGAGIQADVKTITALGGYATTAITALTAQNTLGVFGVAPVEPAFVAEQIEVVLRDLGADAVKTGMLHSAAIVRSTVLALRRFAPNVPLIVDPVMVAKGGESLLEPEARQAVVELLLPTAALVTPNIPEAEVLAGMKIKSRADMAKAAERLLITGAGAILIKGGHLPGPVVVDVLL